MYSLDAVEQTKARSTARAEIEEITLWTVADVPPHQQQQQQQHHHHHHQPELRESNDDDENSVECPILVLMITSYHPARWRS